MSGMFKIKSQVNHRLQTSLFGVVLFLFGFLESRKWESADEVQHTMMLLCYQADLRACLWVVSNGNIYVVLCGCVQ